MVRPRLPWSPVSEDDARTAVIAGFCLAAALVALVVKLLF